MYRQWWQLKLKDPCFVRTRALAAPIHPYRHLMTVAAPCNISCMGLKSLSPPLTNILLSSLPLQIFEANGYDGIDVLEGMTDADLLELDITDATHRAALVKVCKILFY